MYNLNSWIISLEQNQKVMCCQAEPHSFSDNLMPVLTGGEDNTQYWEIDQHLLSYNQPAETNLGSSLKSRQNNSQPTNYGYDHFTMI